MRRSLVFLLAAAVLGISGVTRAGLENSVPVSGTKLSIKDNANPAKRKLTYVAKDAAISYLGGGDAPTAGGFQLELFGSASCQSALWNLPHANWTEKKGKYTYRDKDGIHGPVVAAVAKEGFFKAKAKGAGLDFPLLGTGPQEAVAVNFYSLETVWFTVFSADNATIKKDDPVKGVFVAKDASSGGAFPPSSCTGAFVD
jgi:hypothetical protein